MVQGHTARGFVPASRQAFRRSQRISDAGFRSGRGQGRWARLRAAWRGSDEQPGVSRNVRRHHRHRGDLGCLQMSRARHTQSPTPPDRALRAEGRAVRRLPSAAAPADQRPASADRVAAVMRTDLDGKQPVLLSGNTGAFGQFAPVGMHFRPEWRDPFGPLANTRGPAAAYLTVTRVTLPTLGVAPVAPHPERHDPRDCQQHVPLQAAAQAEEADAGADHPAIVTSVDPKKSRRHHCETERRRLRRECTGSDQLRSRLCSQ